MNSTASSLTANLGGGYQPVFYFNNNDLGVYSTNYTSMITATRTRVEIALKEDPLAQTGIRATYSGDSLRITTLSRFFKATQGEYLLGVYLVEKKVIAPQASQGQQAEHPYVLRTAITPAWQGESLLNGSIAAGSERQLSFAYPLGKYNPENLQIATVIWRKNGSKYEVVNANKANEVKQATTSVLDLSQRGFRWTAGPNPLNRELILQTDFPEASARLQLQLMAINGQLAVDLYQGAWPAGQTQRTFTLPAQLNRGVYILQLRTAQGQLSRQIVVQ